MVRRNISLPEDLDEAARAEGLNVSALAQQAIVGALEQKVRMARLTAWLDDLDAEHGPPSEEAVAEAEAWVKSGTRAATMVDIAQALDESAPTTREVTITKTKKRAAASRNAKSGAFKAGRTAARGAKTTSTSRSGGTKR